MKDAAPAKGIDKISAFQRRSSSTPAFSLLTLTPAAKTAATAGKPLRRLRGDMAGQKAVKLAVGLSAGAFAAGVALPAFAQDSLNISVQDLPAIGAVGAVIVIMSVLVGSILTSSRLRGSSLFNRLFIVVAVSSGFFSGLMYQAHQDSN